MRIGVNFLKTYIEIETEIIATYCFALMGEMKKVGFALVFVRKNRGFLKT